LKSKLPFGKVSSRVPWRGHPAPNEQTISWSSMQHPQQLACSCSKFSLLLDSALSGKNEMSDLWTTFLSDTHASSRKHCMHQYSANVQKQKLQNHTAKAYIRDSATSALESD
jgi:hypothetical protein